jgi:hypothetical protein
MISGQSAATHSLSSEEGPLDVVMPNLAIFFFLFPDAAMRLLSINALDKQ